MVDNANLESDDYYSILGLQKNANEQEIKKNYKKLSLKYHPDKNPENREDSEKKFKKISEAYTILSDKETRDTYDRFGKNGLNRGGGGGGFNQNFNDIFDNFFRGGNHFNFSHNFSNNHIQKKRVVEKIIINLEQVWSGHRIIKNIKTEKDCEKCSGYGYENVSMCEKCSGRGIVMQVRQIGPGIITQTSSNCDKCLGKGRTGTGNVKCINCKGNKTIENTKNIAINIEKGVQNHKSIETEIDNTVFTFFVQIENHPIYTRINNNDILLNKDISLLDALCGISFKLKLLNGKEIIIESPKGVVLSHNTIYVLKEQGLPITGNTEKYGDLHIKFNITMPSTIDDNQVRILCDLFKHSKQRVEFSENYEKIYL